LSLVLFSLHTNLYHNPGRPQSHASQGLHVYYLSLLSPTIELHSSSINRRRHSLWERFSIVCCAPARHTRRIVINTSLRSRQHALPLYMNLTANGAFTELRDSYLPTPVQSGRNCSACLRECSLQREGAHMADSILHREAWLNKVSSATASPRIDPQASRRRPLWPTVCPEPPAALPSPKGMDLKASVPPLSLRRR